MNGPSVLDAPSLYICTDLAVWLGRISFAWLDRATGPRECPAWLKPIQRQARGNYPARSGRQVNAPGLFVGEARLCWSFFVITVEFFAESMSRSCANSKKHSTSKARTSRPSGWATSAMPGSSAKKPAFSFHSSLTISAKAYKAVGLKHASLLHLLRRDNMQARKRAKAGGHKQHKLGKDPLQLGGSFVFAPGTRISLSM